MPQFDIMLLPFHICNAWFFSSIFIVILYFVFPLIAYELKYTSFLSVNNFYFLDDSQLKTSLFLKSFVILLKVNKYFYDIEDSVGYYVWL